MDTTRTNDRGAHTNMPAMTITPRFGDPLTTRCLRLETKSANLRNLGDAPKSWMSRSSRSSIPSLVNTSQMQQSICQSCRTTSRSRLSQRITYLQISRRARSAGPVSQPLQSWYWDTHQPNSLQLAAANWFFQAHRPQNIWTAHEWAYPKNNDKESTVLAPEVAFLGRSNAGKSSVLNAILDAPTLNKVGSTPGKTTVLRAYGLFRASEQSGKKKAYQSTSKNLVTVLDAPGYGRGSQDAWGRAILKYLKERKHLRRVFLLVVAHHGLKPTDFQLLELLRANAIPHQIIATKCDRFDSPTQRALEIGHSIEKLMNYVQPKDSRSPSVALGEILTVGWLGDGSSNQNVKKSDMQGVSAVQWAVLRAAGLEQYAMACFKELPESGEYSNPSTRPNVLRKVLTEESPDEAQSPSIKKHLQINPMLFPLEKPGTEVQGHDPSNTTDTTLPSLEEERRTDKPDVVHDKDDPLTVAEASAAEATELFSTPEGRDLRPPGHGTSRSSRQRRQLRTRPERKFKAHLKDLASAAAARRRKRDRLSGSMERIRSPHKNPFT